MEEVEADADVRRPALVEKRQGRVQAGAEAGRLLEFQRDPDAGVAGQLGRLAKRGAGAVVVGGRELTSVVHRDDEERNPSSLRMASRWRKWSQCN